MIQEGKLKEVAALALEIIQKTLKGEIIDRNKVKVSSSMIDNYLKLRTINEKVWQLNDGSITKAEWIKRRKEEDQIFKDIREQLREYKKTRT